MAQYLKSCSKINFQIYILDGDDTAAVYYGLIKIKTIIDGAVTGLGDDEVTFDLIQMVKDTE